MKLSLSLSLSLLSATLFSAEADAACPSPYNGLTCNSVCSTASNTWTCNLAGANALITMVENYDTTGSAYEAWGASGLAGDFCCESQVGTTYTAFVVNGTTNADTINLIGNAGAWYLRPTGATAVAATVNADAGDDTVNGSSAAINYQETLNGGGGQDTILGRDGDDIINGDANDDVLNGGPGDDTIDGNAGADEIDGGFGADTIYGGIGDDCISGGDDVDTIDGEADNDTICGGNGDDVIDDGDGAAGTEYLWGNGGGDDAYCGSTDTQVDASSMQFGTCSTTVLTTIPVCCP